jgi:hypothetical protein
MSSPFRQEEDTLTVKQIFSELDHKVSIRKIYLLIESGAFGDGNVFRFAGSRGTCVRRPAVLAYKESCRLEVGA